MEFHCHFIMFATDVFVQERVELQLTSNVQIFLGSAKTQSRKNINICAEIRVFIKALLNSLWLNCLLWSMGKNYTV